MMPRFAILGVGLLAVILIYYSARDDDSMMEEQSTMTDTPVLVAPPKDDMSKMMDDGMSDKMMGKEQETRKLLAELRTIPVSEYAVNLSKYERLLELHPGNPKYIRKVSFYSKKLMTKQAGY